MLSGGGARGAYEVGVLSGIIEILRAAGHQGPIFDIFSGSSVGAVNIAWLAAQAHRPDYAIQGLVSHWEELRFQEHLRFNLKFWGRGGKALCPKGKLPDVETLGWSAVNPLALETLVRREVPWDELHASVRSGRVRSVIVSALDIASGRSTLFVEKNTKANFQSSLDNGRVAREEAITADHVLASAAIPMLFPARRVGSRFYCDGGIRSNTPISPAIRAGATRLVVVSLRFDHRDDEAEYPAIEAERVASYPRAVFLMGKILSALLLDPVQYDLRVLQRLNRLLSTLEGSLNPSALAELHRTTQEARGLPYRAVETLVFQPSRDIGHLAAQRANELRGLTFSSFVLRQLSRLGSTWEADLLSFLLFDGVFAARLITLGRLDALRRKEEVLRFFQVKV